MRLLFPRQVSERSGQRSGILRLLNGIAAQARWPLAVAILLILAPPGHAEDKRKQPNVIVILADDRD
jgi:hypothetical protein